MELTRTKAEHFAQMNMMHTALEATRGQADHARLALEAVVKKPEEASARPRDRTWDIVDTKLLQKPTQLKGQDAQWPMRSFKWATVCGV